MNIKEMLEPDAGINRSIMVWSAVIICSYVVADAGISIASFVAVAVTIFICIPYFKAMRLYLQGDIDNIKRDVREIKQEITKGGGKDE